MATTNPVFQVLPTSGNQALLAAGARPDTLAVGQLGIFNYHTGLSIDGSVPGDARDIVIAVGINKTGAGAGATLEDVTFSAGQMIQVRNAKSYTYRPTVLELPKIVDLFGFVARCETTYTIKFEVRNGDIYATNGYNRFVKTFSYYTGCCADQCTPCGSGDCIELAQGLVKAVNADPDALIVATYFQNFIGATVTAAATATGSLTVTIGTTAYTVAVTSGDTAAQVAGKIVAAVNTQSGSPYTASANAAAMRFNLEGEGTGTFALTSAGGTGVTVGSITAATKSAVTDPVAYKAANPGACLGIRFTTNPVAIAKYSGINVKYSKGRATDIIPILSDGFTCNGTFTTIQEARQSEGSGYDLGQLEYFAGGWNGRPGVYRVSDATSLGRDVERYVNQNTLYQQIDLTYDQMSVGGWLEYLNNLRTIIAIPCTDTATVTSLIGVLDLIFTQFGAMANDAAANNDCDNPNVTTLTFATDGIESLA